MSTATLQDVIDSGVKLTPMMAQYSEIKKNYTDAFLLFRMGDFYEVFFEDACLASKYLNIALTHRGKLGDFKIPMAGIPHHAASAYIDRLTSQGLKVAICEQVENPKDAVGIVKRAVTQVVSPGMPYDLDKTNSSERHFMTSAYKSGDTYFLTAIDFTTGEFSGHTFKSQEEFLNKLRLFSPKEFITYMGQWDDWEELEKLIEVSGILRTYLSEEYFDTKYTGIYIEKLIPTYKRDKVLKLNSEVLSPIGALSYYICSTQQVEEFVHIKPFRMVSNDGKMKVTLPTLTGLEIIPRTRETYKDSLLGFIDKTQTAMGSRALKSLILSPIDDKELIEKRLDLVDYFNNNDELLSLTRDELSEIRDIERILAKVTTKKANGGDLLNLGTAIGKYKILLKKLDKSVHKIVGTFSKSEWTSLQDLSAEIEKTINDEIGANLDKGNLIKKGCSKKRDRLAKLANSADDELTKLAERYREETGISKLRVKRNNVAGYFIEVSKLHSNDLPKKFVRKQTLVNAERFLTEELSLLEKDMVSAQDKLEKVEREIFKELIEKVIENNFNLMNLAKILGLIDSYQSLSWISLQEGFTRPIISEDKKLCHIQGGWHPLIKSVIREQFVTHDLLLNEECYFGLITGPNMAGKTTVMREIAIIQLLAQIGSFVPATSANISLCDFLFSRLGASDDILKGQSTFMVEMSETAEIIRHATHRSLIILDEVGRGTSTYDGLSIAWSLVEHFVSKTKALCLFATHYHELIDLAHSLPQAKNLTVETTNYKGNVQFLYRLIEEGASQSFGIYVAKLAGIPDVLLKRSKSILKGLEQQHSKKNETADNFCENQLSFFANEEEAEIEVPDYLQEMENEISNINILEMTPLDAMKKLDDLKKSLDNNQLQ